MLQEILQYDLNVYAVLLLLIILISILAKKEIYSFQSRLLLLILVFNMTMLILEVFSWAFDGIQTETAHSLNHTFNFLFTATGPLTACIWASYIDYNVFKSRARIRKRIYYLYPLILSVVLSIINIITPIVYFIDEENIYHRLPLIWINVVSVYFLYMYTIYIVFKNRKRINRNLPTGVVVFLIIPALGAAIQMLVYGLLVIWPTMALAMAFTYMYIETVSSSKDYLTNLYTRERADEYLEHLITQKTFFVVSMIDLDNFKELNDNYGHNVGDQVLVAFGNALHHYFGKSMFISRFGGDEFILISTMKTLNDIQYELNEFKEYIAKQHDFELLTKLEFSHGSCTLLEIQEPNVTKVIVCADDRMYQNKADNKNYKRRKDDV